MNSKRSFVLCLAVPALIAVVYCGGSNPSPPTSPAPGPTVTAIPGPTPPPLAPLVCDPTPPPIRYIGVKIHSDSGYTKVLDSKLIVQNVDRYCQRVGVPGRFFCQTRLEGDPQQADCDRMAMGVSDTGRHGPTWSYEGQPCRDNGSDPGCYHHPDNQFLVKVKGTGEFAACAAEDAPVDPDEGARCGFITITSTTAP